LGGRKGARTIEHTTTDVRNYVPHRRRDANRLRKQRTTSKTIDGAFRTDSLRAAHS